MSVVSEAIPHPEPTPRTDALVFRNGCSLGHLLGPHLSEETVISHANILSDALWRDRWRRVES